MRDEIAGFILEAGENSSDYEPIVIHADLVIDYVNGSSCKKMNDMSTSVIKLLLKAINARDKNTGKHSEHVAYLMVTLANRIGLSKEEISLAYVSGLVHDIGKIGIPESILNKPTQLTETEFALIKQHPNIGADILSEISGFEKIVEIVRYHHERYDGKGYPYGIQAQEIPILSRMLVLCDSYDAMTTPRCYREPFKPDRALAEIEQLSGRQFDPELSRIFIDLVLGANGAQECG